METRDLTGLQFGRWTALERVDKKGAARWRCRCSCGTEREVAARNLIGGNSLSCGCLNRESVSRSTRADWVGRRFGKLVVLERAEKSPRGAAQWRCLCDCGRECVVLHSSLQTGKRTSCGCDSRRGKATVKDVSGQRFRMLTALYPTGRRSGNGSVVWHCRCDCGRETDVSLSELLHSPVISCGCMKEKCGQELADKLTHVAGTSIDALRSRKLRTDNKTGVKGVYVKRGKYCAMITFQQKSYYLGSYMALEAAAEVRKEAETLLHGEAILFYEQWKRLADADPTWAEQNPIDIKVTRKDDGAFTVELLPELCDAHTARAAEAPHPSRVVC